jgi:hypothetical protein
MLPAEQAGCWSGKTAVEAMRRLWMLFTARREQRRMWVEEEEETDRQTVCMRADKARARGVGIA